MNEHTAQNASDLWPDLVHAMRAAEIKHGRAILLGGEVSKQVQHLYLSEARGANVSPRKVLNTLHLLGAAVRSGDVVRVENFRDGCPGWKLARS